MLKGTILYLSFLQAYNKLFEDRPSILGTALGCFPDKDANLGLLYYLKKKKSQVINPPFCWKIIFCWEQEKTEILYVADQLWSRENHSILYEDFNLWNDTLMSVFLIKTFLA